VLLVRSSSDGAGLDRNMDRMDQREANDDEGVGRGDDVAVSEVPGCGREAFKTAPSTC